MSPRARALQVQYYKTWKGGNGEAGNPFNFWACHSCLSSRFYFRKAVNILEHGECRNERTCSDLAALRKAPRRSQSDRGKISVWEGYRGNNIFLTPHNPRSTGGSPQQYKLNIEGTYCNCNPYHFFGNSQVFRVSVRNGDSAPNASSHTVRFYVRRRR